MWETGTTGKGVAVKVNDDLLEVKHPEFQGQMDATKTFNFKDNKKDPTPSPGDGNDHGTFVSGIISARRDGKGIVGMAYEAKLSFSGGFGRGPMDDVDTINLSWGPGSQNNDCWYAKERRAGKRCLGSIFSGTPFGEGRTGVSFLRMLAQAVRDGRGGLGTVVLASAGNTGLRGVRSNAFEGANRRETMSIAAHTRFGPSSGFSSHGANIHVSCPGSEIVSTDRTGDEGYSTKADALDIGTDYYSSQGTSYSSPVCTGIVALVLQARPQLGWRDVQEIMALAALTAAAPNDRGLTFTDNGAGQSLNGAGYRSSGEHGFGLADAFGAVRLAETWVLGTARTTANEVVYTGGTLSPGVAIADKNKVVSKMKVSRGKDMRMMQVEVTISIVHPRLGDLSIFITSPKGTTGVLMQRPATPINPNDPNDFGLEIANIDAWPYTSNRQWGEGVNGEWTLTVEDGATGQTGTLTAW